MTDEQLRAAFEQLSASAPHDPTLAATIRRRSRWSRGRVIAPIAAVLAVLLVFGAVVLFQRSAPVASTAASASACGTLTPQVLPSWARSGFSDPEPKMPYVTGSGGTMVGIVFADPLVSPALPDRGNKILWVTSDNDSAGQGLRITGHLENGTATMTSRVDGGPGPSYVDVPVPGCWILDLAWGSHHETVALRYVPAASVSSIPAASLLPSG